MSHFKFALSSALLTLTISVRAAAPVPEVPVEYNGLWLGVCDKESEVGFPTQDVLEIKNGTVIQHSLMFEKSKTCDTPSVVSEIIFSAQRSVDAAKLKIPTPALDLKPIRVQIAALTVEGAVGLTNRAECEIKAWDAHRRHDCSQAQPYKLFINSQKFTLALKLDKGKLHSKEYRDGESGDDDVFTKLTALPFGLDKIQ